MASDEQDKDAAESGARNDAADASAPDAAATDEKTHISEPQQKGVPKGTQIIGTYEIADMIAAGGMGEVYRGFNIHTNQSVAIKIVLDDMAEDETILSLFRREATILGDLNHEAIVRYHIFTKDPELKRACLVMEFVEGRQLGDVLADAPLSERDVHTLLTRLAPGLQKAHDMGVVHRDLSPDNIIVQDGMISHAKIIDFGIAKSGTETKHGKTVLGDRFAGKYGFVAPEQLFLYKGIVTGKSDIYALGLVAVACLQGRPLDMGDNMPDAMERRSGVPDLTGVPEGMRPLLTWMLQPDPTHRPESMAQLAEALRDPALIPDLEVSTAPQTPPPAAPASPVSSQPPSGWAFDDSGKTAADTSAPAPDRTEIAAPPAGVSAAPATGSGGAISTPPSNPFGTGSAPEATQIALPGASLPPMQSSAPVGGPVRQPTLPPQAPSAADDVPPSSLGNEDSPFGAAPAVAPAPSPERAAPPAPAEPKKKSSLVPILAVLLLAGGGGGAYMAGLFDGSDTAPSEGQQQIAAVAPPSPSTPPAATSETVTPEPEPAPTTPEPEPEPEPAPDPQPPAPPAAELAPIGTQAMQGAVFAAVPPAPEPEVGCTDSDLECVAQMVTWLNAYDLPDCTHLDVTSASADGIDIVGFGTQVAPFQRLLGDFEAAHAVEPDINVRPVDARQCPAVEMLSQIGSGSGVAPVLRLDRDRVEYGGAIRGTITDVGDRELWLIMVDQSGRFYNLTPLAAATDSGIRRFALQLSGGAANTDATPQMMIALASDRALSAINTATNRIADIAPAVLEEIARTGAAVNVGAAYFRFEPQ